MSATPAIRRYSKEYRLPPVMLAPGIHTSIFSISDSPPFHQRTNKRRSYSPFLKMSGFHPLRTLEPCPPNRYGSEMGYVLVFIGGGIGAALRHGVNRAAHIYLGASFPYGTLIVNVAGGLLMGVMAGLFLVKTGVGEGTRQFLATGILGGFTTFSAFSLDATLMWQRGDYGLLALYAVGSVVLSIAALALGLWAVRSLNLA